MDANLLLVNTLLNMAHEHLRAKRWADAATLLEAAAKALRAPPKKLPTFADLVSKSEAQSKPKAMSKGGKKSRSWSPAQRKAAAARMKAWHAARKKKG